MKLTYRGVVYEKTASDVELQDSGLHGKYRGQDVNFKVANVENNAPDCVLQYRGVLYNPRHQEAVTVAPQAAPVAPALAVSTKDEARSLMMRHQRAIKVRQQALLERAAEEVGLTLSTKVDEYWGRIQGKVNPSFRATYDRSHAALS